MIDTIKKAKSCACSTVSVVLICCEICGYFSLYGMEVWNRYLLGLQLGMAMPAVLGANSYGLYVKVLELAASLVVLYFHFLVGSGVTITFESCCC
jgi:hypothetical protein